MLSLAREGARDTSLFGRMQTGRVRRKARWWAADVCPGLACESCVGAGLTLSWH